MTKDVLNIASQAAGRLLARGALPCSILSKDPPILAAFGWDFYNYFDIISQALPQNRPVYVLMKLGYECETLERVDQEKKMYHDLKNWKGNINYIYLCNSQKEVYNLTNIGIESVFCNQNSFLDEKRYPIIKSPPKKYDAIYLARVTPVKRHHLANKIQRLLVIGDYFEKDYAIKEMNTISHATWLKRVYGFNVCKHMASAHVGLCLSDREGAMYVSTEYLLCGLPVVSTPNIGGRDEFFGPEYVRVVDPEPDLVASAVYELIDLNIDPLYIRAEALKKIKTHRDNFVSLLGAIFDKEGMPFDRENAWIKFFFHKLGVRTIVSPNISWNKLLRLNTFN